MTVKLVYNDLPKIPAEIRSEVAAEIAKAGFDIEAAAKAKAAVRTGLMRRSIHTVLSNGGMTAKIGPSVDYGVYVEFGTRHMGARPYMRPAAALVYPKFVDRVKALLKGIGR